MPQFVKNPKVIIGTIVVLWVAYVISANLNLEIDVRLIPFAATLDFKVPAVMIASAIFGSGATLIIQWLWKRRSSKNGSASAAASAASTSTVA